MKEYIGEVYVGSQLLRLKEVGACSSLKVVQTLG